jgi:hypothetical protein
MSKCYYSKEDVARHTNLCVKCHTRAKTNACVKATTILEPLGGSESKIPGVKTKNRRNA